MYEVVNAEILGLYGSNPGISGLRKRSGIRDPGIAISTASPALVINLIKPLLETINKQFSQDFSHNVSHFSIFQSL
jgi:hypothetical protein